MGPWAWKEYSRYIGPWNNHYMDFQGNHTPLSGDMDIIRKLLALKWVLGALIMVKGGNLWCIP